MCLRFCSFCFGSREKPQPDEAASSGTPTPSLPRFTAANLPIAEKTVPNKPISPKPAINPTASDPLPRLEQQQIPAVPASLPSRVDETLADCPRFRIVLVGNSGVGKSSLVRSIFNIDPDSDLIDIAHDRPGDADIEREYTSPTNIRFILHDSKGFEAGSKVNWVTVEKFLQGRRDLELPRRIHAIWFCIETPRKGGRLLQTGDERLLELAKELEIPIIAVFTKYDLLETQVLRDKKGERDALESFGRCVKELQDEWGSIPCVKVSTTEQQTLINLTIETRNRLHEVEVLWVAAQQVNPWQKVEASISEGFKKYWRNLGRSSEFEGQILIDCIHRIHDDVLKVWNFNDPTKILSGTDFFTQMIGLVKPLIDDQVDQTLSPTGFVPGFGSTGATVLVPLLEKFGFKLPAIQYLYDKYQKYPSTANFLATYIINLILILHGVFTDVLLQSSDPARALSNDLVANVLRHHNADLTTLTPDDIDFATNPEQAIERVIRNQLGLLPD